MLNMLLLKNQRRFSSLGNSSESPSGKEMVKKSQGYTENRPSEKRKRGAGEAKKMYSSHYFETVLLARKQKASVSRGQGGRRNSRVGAAEKG